MNRHPKDRGFGYKKAIDYCLAINKDTETTKKQEINHNLNK